MAVGDIYRCVAYQSLKGQNLLNVGFWQTTFESTGGATPFEIATSFDSTMGPAYRTGAVDSYSYRGFSVQRIAVLTPPEPTFAIAAAGAGSEEDEPLPVQVAGVISLRTGLAGRRYRGRKYIGGFGEAANVNADSMLATIANDRLDALIDEWVHVNTVVGVGGTTTLVPVLFHRDIPGTTRILTGKRRDQWGTMRTRSLISGSDALVPVAT